jgi:hypothetical protein
MQSKNFFQYIFCATLVVYATACSKMNATYDEFLEDGETIYVGKADSVKAMGGKNRLQLQFLLISDPKISRYKVYWNGRNDSLVNSVTRGAGVDTIRVIIDKNLVEGPNNFEIYTFDKLGHSSMKAEVIGYMYNTVYQSEIAPRAMKPLELSDDGLTVKLTWFPAQTGEVRTEVTYTDKTDVQRTITVLPGQLTTNLPDYKEGGAMSYKTFYTPEPAAIDVFTVNSLATTLPLFERKLDKSLFKEKVLPTDVATGFGWVMPRLWDNNLGLGYATANNSGVGKWFTFDMGVTANLSKYRLWQTQDRIYRDQNALTWEIWGTDNPPADGSFTNWTKLMTCQSIKPSGLPLGQTTAADVAYAAAGQEFIFPAGLPPVRYIRIKVITNYGLQTFQTMGEISFWTIDH